MSDPYERERMERMRDADMQGSSAAMWAGLALVAAIIIGMFAFANFQDSNVATTTPPGSATTGSAPSGSDSRVPPGDSMRGPANKPAAPPSGPSGN